MARLRREARDDPQALLRLRRAEDRAGLWRKPEILELLPDVYDRSKLANDLLHQIREGAQDPAQIVEEASRSLRRRASCVPRKTGPDGAGSRAGRVLKALTAEPKMAIEAARYYARWEALSGEEKEAIREPAREEGRAQSMRVKPLSVKQEQYLRNLGHCGPLPPDRWQASKRIEELREKRRRRV